MNDIKSIEEGIAAFDNKDYTNAFNILLPLAVEGVAAAQSIIGGMYQLGLGVPVDGSKAVEWQLKAADQGYALACHNLGTLYAAGMPGVPSDPEKAKIFYDKAAELGFDMPIKYSP